MKILVLVIFLTLTSCIGTYVMPNTTNLTDSEISLITVKNYGSAMGKWSSSITKVVGESGVIMDVQGPIGGYKELKLSPGKYTLYMGCKFGSLVSVKDIAYSISIKKNYTYVMDCQFIDEKHVKLILIDSYPTNKS